MSDILGDSQSGSLGGADKKTGAHGKDTHQKSDERHIVIIARYKPKASPFSATDMASTEGLIGSVTGAVEKAVSAVEDVMASIPGLQMFIKEDKQDSPSEKEYKYEYAEWDKKTSKLDSDIKKVFKENTVPEIFEFSATDIDGRVNAAKELYDNNLKSALAKWSGYKVRIHLIGIAQGGNVLNELTDILSKDAQFKSENWLVRSVFYIGTPAYSDLHKLNKLCLKSEGSIFNLSSSLDLTQQAIAFFAPQEDFIKFIADSNSNTMSLAVGKIKLTIVKILSLFLGNSNISSSNPHGLDKFAEIKPEVENLVKQMTGMIKQIVSEIAAFIDPGKLPEFSDALNGLDDIPSQTGKAFSKFISDLGDTIEKQGKKTFSGGGNLGPQDLMGVFNCLCPLLDQIAKAIAVFDYDSPASIALANQMIENAGIKEIYGKGKLSGSSIELNSISEDYFKERLKIFQEEGKLDKINKLIQDATKLLVDLKKDKVSVSDLSDDKKIALAGALYTIIQPMLLSKKRVLEELQVWIAKLNIGDLLKDISANKLLGFAGDALNSALGLHFEQPLNNSINHVDTQLDRLKSFFKRREYDLHKNTLYYIFNVHNQVVNSFFDDLHYNLDRQTGFLDYMQNRGSKNQFSVSRKNTYDPDAEKDNGDLMPTNKVPESATK
jgi:hypothetical protein